MIDAERYVADLTAAIAAQARPLRALVAELDSRQATKLPTIRFNGTVEADRDRRARARFWAVLGHLVDPDDPRRLGIGLLEDLAMAWDELERDEQTEIVVTLRAAARGARPIVGP